MPTCLLPYRYPALQWQLRAARRALAAVAAAGPWLQECVALTRYAHVPLAGLGRDALMSIADVLMARRLREAGHVLWTVDPALPDLGRCTQYVGGRTVCADKLAAVLACIHQQQIDPLQHITQRAWNIH